MKTLVTTKPLWTEPTNFNTQFSFWNIIELLRLCLRSQKRGKVKEYLRSKIHLVKRRASIHTAISHSEDLKSDSNTHIVYGEGHRRVL